MKNHKNNELSHNDDNSTKNKYFGNNDNNDNNNDNNNEKNNEKKCVNCEKCHCNANGCNCGCENCHCNESDESDETCCG